MSNGTTPGRRKALVLTLIVGIVAGIASIAVTNAAVHWSGSNEFCSSACHSMQWAAEAYRRSPHYASHSGVTAGCGDCHIPYHSTDPGALQYVAMLAYKAKVGTRDAIAQARGVIDTKDKWEKARAGYSEEVKEWMAGNGSLTCRGCHDLEKMGGGKAQPAIAEMHAGLAKAGAVNCLDCHASVGHVYETAAAGPASPAKTK